MKSRLQLQVAAWLLVTAACLHSAASHAQTAPVHQLAPQWANTANVSGYYASAQDVCDARTKAINWFTALTYRAIEDWRGECGYYWQGTLWDAMAFPRFGSRCPKGYSVADSLYTNHWYEEGGTVKVYREPGKLCTKDSPPRIEELTGGQPVHRDASCPVGHPCLPGTGTKTLTETDYQGAGAHPLVFNRTYHSWRRVAPDGSLDGQWMHNYQARIALIALSGASGLAYALRPDGTIRKFSAPSSATPRVWQAERGSRDTLLQLVDAAGATTGWTYGAADDDSSESYAPDGRLLSIAGRQGWTTTLTYSDASTPAAVARRPGLLIAIRNHFGRELRLAYDSSDRVTQLLPPGAVQDAGAGAATSPIRYAYAEAASLGANVPLQGQLTSVTWQDGAVRRFVYEDPALPGHLSGVVDEIGVRFSSYQYDSYGRLARSELAGGAQRLDFSYEGDWSAQTQSAAVTDYEGANGSAQQHRYTFVTDDGVRRPSAVSSPCRLCGSTNQSSTYDALGRTARQIGHDGRITFFKYDTKGRETERATFPAAYNTATSRPALSVAERVVSTKWHSTWNLPTQVAEPQKVTAYTYGTGGRLTGESWTATTDATGAAKFAAVKTGSTYAKGYGYNASVLNSSIVERTDSAETGRWTMAFDPLGNVTRTTHVGSGAVSTVTAYDAHGRMLTGRNDSGTTVGLEYSPRAYVTRKIVGTESTAFFQNATGLTTEVRMPGNQTLEYVYDAGHTLTDVRLNGASITPAMLAASDYPNTPSKALVARAKVLLERRISALIAPAYAQPAGQLGRRVVPIPGGAMPGQPQFDPRTDMMSVAPISALDRAAVRLAEEFARMCECKPDGGYDRPTFTFVTFAHVLFSGHLSQRFSDKSYFAPTEKVGQALVDEVISRGREVSRPSDSRVVFEADLVRPVNPVGYARTKAMSRSQLEPVAADPSYAARLTERGCSSRPRATASTQRSLTPSIRRKDFSASRKPAATQRSAMS